MAFAPCVVVLHAEADDSGAIVVHQRVCEYEEQRVSVIDGQIDFVTQDEIVLSVVLIDIVDERSTAKGVARIKRCPDVVIEGIAEVSFHSGQRLLTQDFRPMV